MKSNNLFLLLIGGLFFVGSCKKEALSSKSTIAALNIINAVPDAPSVTVSFSDTLIPYYLNQNLVYYGYGVEYGLVSGSNPLIIVSSADTSQPLTQTTVDLKPGGIYSLYLTGQSPKTELLFLQDTIPVHNDSTAGVRFINLSPDSGPISINLEGNDPANPDFSGLAYKQISSFKNYSASNGVTSYNFEIRDQATGNLLTTFSWNMFIFKNNTLVISGFENGTSGSPMIVSQVNNF